MEQERIKAMLNYPDAALVRHAVERANLTDDEWAIVNMREHKCLSIERAAERLDTSVRTVNRRYQEGMDKLDRCWSGLPWVDTLIKQ